MLTEKDLDEIQAWNSRGDYSGRPGELKRDLDMLVDAVRQLRETLSTQGREDDAHSVSLASTLLRQAGYAEMASRLDAVAERLWPESLDWGPGKKATSETAATVIREQSLDDGLWFIPQTAPEDYLQRALRRLHAAVEGKTPKECAIAALSK